MSTLQKIKQSILNTEREFLISCVNYIDHKKDYTSIGNSFAPFFYKDASYSNEREVRFAIIQNFSHIGDKNFEDLSFEKGIFIPIDFTLLIQKIVISSSVQSEEFKDILCLLQKFNLQDKMSFSKY